MRTVWITVVAVALVGLGAGLAVAQDVDAKLLLLEGRRLSADEARELERRLEENSDDLASHARLIGFYSKGNLSIHAHAARRRHIFWMIENHPASEVCDSSACALNSRTETQAFEHARGLWEKAIARGEKTAKILANAARFMLRNDPTAAQLYLERAREIEPDNPEWPRQLAALFAVLARYGPPKARDAVLRKALENWEAAYLLTEEGDAKLRMLPSMAKAAFATGENEQARLYARKKDEGLSDSRIFSLLFPAPTRPPRAVSVDVEILNKKQLIALIEQKLGASLASLAKLNKADLVEMLVALNARG